MTILERYQCDVTEDVYADEANVTEVVIRTYGRTDFDITERTFHVAKEVFGEGSLESPEKFEWLGGTHIEDDEGEIQRRIVGGLYQIGHPGDRHPQWFDRGDYVIRDYEPFFEILEDELIW